MNEQLHNEFAEDLAVQIAKPKLKEPSMYKVLILNDDFTPMDYVVMVLKEFFAMTNQRATEVMLQVHMHGQGICGIFTREIAETKVAQVSAHARGNEYPLLCTMEVS